MKFAVRGPNHTAGSSGTPPRPLLNKLGVSKVSYPKFGSEIRILIPTLRPVNICVGNVGQKCRTSFFPKYGRVGKLSAGQHSTSFFFQNMDVLGNYQPVHIRVENVVRQYQTTMFLKCFLNLNELGNSWPTFLPTFLGF